ncbi:alpha/beta hydrolase family protein [Undibacterium hunanense]|uniref:alpha/beta hydrolase family protein n=1 Tax=Undibacterium hunanense TaxID=2762292 RepID=UPI001E480EC7|nr:dienelactone hydrolase [Undibacterium hunanense]
MHTLSVFSIRRIWRSYLFPVLILVLFLWANRAQAGVGLEEIPATATDGIVTLFYPTQAEDQPLRRGRFVLNLAERAGPIRGNGRLIVISHGSGGGPWVHVNLARALVEAGFVVAMPQHHADNFMDESNPGPDSWTLRPAEVSRAIDAVGRDTRFASLLMLDKVGIYGMSAGGHTALSMAGGRWSPAGFKQHCEASLEEDFQSCVGLITRLTGSMFDGIKKWAAMLVIRHRFSDATPREHHDPRVAAVVAGVPTAADFDMTSLAHPAMPVALITAGQDHWLIPRFHSDLVMQACKSCVLLAHLPAAGHGALLSPLPPGLTGLVGDMLNDPPGFDRSQMAEVDQKIARFFEQHLLQK